MQFYQSQLIEAERDAHSHHRVQRILQSRAARNNTSREFLCLFDDGRQEWISHARLEAAKRLFP